MLNHQVLLVCDSDVESEITVIGTMRSAFVCCNRSGRRRMATIEICDGCRVGQKEVMSQRPPTITSASIAKLT